MQVDASTRLGEIAAEIPASMRLFDRLGIDYACGGERTLGEIAGALRAPLEEIIEAVEACRAEPHEASRVDWRKASLSQLITHLVEHHHAPMRAELERAERLFASVLAVHGDRRPELTRLRSVFAGLRSELLTHLLKDEKVLFPYILSLEEAEQKGLRAPVPPFYSAARPLQRMRIEHAAAVDAGRKLRAYTNGFLPPADASPRHQELFASLSALERAFVVYVHLENNILFMRALELEQRGIKQLSASPRAR